MHIQQYASKLRVSYLRENLHVCLFGYSLLSIVLVSDYFYQEHEYFFHRLICRLSWSHRITLGQLIKALIIDLRCASCQNKRVTVELLRPPNVNITYPYMFSVQKQVYCSLQALYKGYKLSSAVFGVQAIEDYLCSSYNSQPQKPRTVSLRVQF